MTTTTSKEKGNKTNSAHRKPKKESQDHHQGRHASYFPKTISDDWGIGWGQFLDVESGQKEVRLRTSQGTIKAFTHTPFGREESSFFKNAQSKGWSIGK